MTGHCMINGKEVSKEEVIEFLNRGKVTCASVSAASQVIAKAAKDARHINNRKEQSELSA